MLFFQCIGDLIEKMGDNFSSNYNCIVNYDICFQ